MNIYKVINVFILVFASQIILAQNDTSWIVSLKLSSHVATEVVNEVDLKMVNTSCKMVKNGHSLIFDLTNKRSVFNSGEQMGISYYKTMNKGYSYLGLFKSNSPIYPNWIVDGAYFYNIIPKAELSMGLRRILYHDNTKSTTVSPGLAYYLGNWMLSYRYNQVLGQTSYHRGSIRKIYNSKLDYVDISFSNGYEQVTNVSTITYGVSSLSCNIFWKTHLSPSWVLASSVAWISSQKESRQKDFYNYGISLEYTF